MSLPHPLDKEGNLNFIKSNCLNNLTDILEGQLHCHYGMFSDVDEAIDWFELELDRMKKELKKKKGLTHIG